MLQSIDSNFLDEPMEHIIKIYLTRVSAFYFLLLQTLPQKEKKKNITETQDIVGVIQKIFMVIDINV